MGMKREADRPATANKHMNTTLLGGIIHPSDIHIIILYKCPPRSLKPSDPPHQHPRTNILNPHQGHQPPLATLPTALVPFPTSSAPSLTSSTTASTACPNSSLSLSIASVACPHFCCAIHRCFSIACRSSSCKSRISAFVSCVSSMASSLYHK